MKTRSKYYHCFFLVSFCIVHVDAQNCNYLKRRDAAQTYTVPTSHGSTTASALLAENNLSRLETFSNCTIYFESGVDFEIDVPLSLSQVTVISDEGCGIKVNSHQTLVINNCKLIPQIGSYWTGIKLEDEADSG